MLFFPFFWIYNILKGGNIIKEEYYKDITIHEFCYLFIKKKKQKKWQESQLSVKEKESKEKKWKRKSSSFTGSVDIVPEIVAKPEIGREKLLRSSRGSARSFFLPPCHYISNSPAMH